HKARNLAKVFNRKNLGADEAASSNSKLEGDASSCPKPQSGDGTFIKKITIMISPINSFAINPATLPRNVPQPARPAFTISFPPIISPAIAPITGPTKSPSKPKNNPASAPATQPIKPHFVAPQRKAPRYPAAASIA